MPSNIEWTGESWNPIRARTPDGKVGWHCEHASPGCQHCYAETQNIAQRFDLGTGLPYKPGHRKDVETFLDEAALLKPLGWKKPRTIFVCSMTDLFGDFVTDEMIDRVFAVMALCGPQTLPNGKHWPGHTFQVLTKRSARMREWFSPDQYRRTARAERVRAEMQAIKPDRIGGLPDWPLPNVWLGVSVEDQQRADERIPDLLATPAALRWISAEPLLGPVDLTAITVDGDSELDALQPYLWGAAISEWQLNGEDDWVEAFEDWFSRHPSSVDQKAPVHRTLDWVVAGGESGKDARPMHPDWPRALRDQCAAAVVPFFFKQWGEWEPRHSWGERRMVAIDATGRNVPDDVVPQNVGGQRFVRVGKKRAGRLLDGVLHDAMPGQADA